MRAVKRIRRISLASTGLVMLAIVALVDVAVWYTWPAHNSGSLPLSPVHRTRYTDTAKVYELSYPATWSLSYPSAEGEGAAPDWSKQSRAIDITPPDAPEHNSVSIQADTTSYLAHRIQQGWAMNNHQPAKLTINGYDAQYVRVIFHGEAERYTDDEYLLTHTDASIFITFRENYYHVSPAANWDASRDIPPFNTIVQSITFLR